MLDSSDSIESTISVSKWKDRRAAIRGMESLRISRGEIAGMGKGVGIGVKVAVGSWVGLGATVGFAVGKDCAVDITGGGTGVGEIKTALVLCIDESLQEMAIRVANVSIAVNTWGLSRSLRYCLILG